MTTRYPAGMPFRSLTVLAVLLAGCRDDPAPEPITEIGEGLFAEGCPRSDAALARQIGVEASLPGKVAAGKGPSQEDRKANGPRRKEAMTRERAGKRARANVRPKARAKKQDSKENAMGAERSATPSPNAKARAKDTPMSYMTDMEAAAIAGGKLVTLPQHVENFDHGQTGFFFFPGFVGF